ncbi:sugar isomerase domain-containing protein [Halobacillus fulvus]|nr:sugar isomerase domain-containing protein [Halobacillus fulvus]
MTYLSKVAQLLQEIEKSEDGPLDKVSQGLANVIGNGGLIHTFGCGHSSLLAQDVYYRAGGLVPVRPILIECLMLHKGAKKSSDHERTPGLVESYLDEEDIQKGDAVVILSTSGRNPAPVEVARYCRAKGLYTVGLTSLAYRDSQPSRHPDGYRLEDVVDDVLDMKVPVGDAIMDGGATNSSPASSVLGAGLLHELFSRTILQIERTGETAPVFLSGNIDGADEHNQNLIDTYTRINF